MYNKFKIATLFCLFVVFLFSCGEEEYAGDELISYPDFNQILQDEWDMDAPLVYWRVIRTASMVDSVQVQSTEMPWEVIKDIFSKANIQKEELNHHYAIDILNDSVSNSITLYYKALAPKDFTRKVSIVSDGESSDLISLYFETNEKGDANRNGDRILFVPNKLLQIQKRQDKSIAVETYYFPK